MQEINGTSYAWTPEVAVILEALFYQKWEEHPKPFVLGVMEHSKSEWCNERLRNLASGHAHNCVVNTS